jgi:signal transduction histidine kinase
MKTVKHLCLLTLFFLLSFQAAMAQSYYNDMDSVAQYHRLYRSAKTDANLVGLCEALSHHYRRNNIDSALFYGRLELKVSQRANNKIWEAMALADMEYCLRETGDLAEALNIELQTLTLSKKLKAPLLEGQLLNSIGNTYMDMGDPRTGLNYYRESLAVFQKLNFPYWKLNEPSNMGNAFEKLNMLDSALYYERISYSTKHFPADLLPELMERMGNVSVKLGKYQEALAYYRKGLVYEAPVKTVTDKALLYYLMAKVFERLNLPDSGIFYARHSFLTARSISLRGAMLSSSQLLASLYGRRSNTDSAYHYQQIAMRYNDTLFGAEKFNRIQHILSNEQQRQQTLIQEQEDLKNRYELIGGMAALLFLLTISVLIWRNNRMQRVKNKILGVQKTQLTEQRDQLQATVANLHKAQTQLIQAEKMASLGELTAGIAHEIQNPLNFVNNFSEVSAELVDEMDEELEKGDIAEAKAIGADLKQNLEKIRHHGKRADFIVKGMLEHSRTSKGEKTLTNINVFADEFLKLSYHGLRAKDKNFNAEMVTHFDETLPKIEIVQQDIGRVLLNLFNNAFYAVNQKMKTAGPDYKPKVELTTFAPPSGGWGVSVLDNGSGIPDAIKDKIMQPFFTTKPTGEGTGLGLSLSYDIVVKGHGGSITVDTKEGEFTGFTITLPYV